MTRGALLFIVSVVPWLVLASAGAHGQTVPPATSTPVPAATPMGKPNASQVVDLMMRAWVAAGSEHFTINEDDIGVQGASSTQVKMSEVGDINWGSNPPIFQMTSPTITKKKTATGPATTKRSTEIQVYNQDLLAVKLGKKPWSCNHFFGYKDLPGSPYWDGTSPYGFDARNLGVTQVHGIRVWHVRVYHMTGPPKGKRVPRSVASLDYFVSITDGLPVKFHTSSKYWTAKGHGSGNSTMRFSNFGESVHVTLPPRCAKA